MRKFSLFIAAAAILGIGVFSCNKTEFVPEDEISAEVIDKVARLGFNPEGMTKEEDGYLVEGDILLTEVEINSIPNALRVPGAEQYHTFNLVAAPRVITVFVDSKLPSSYAAATQVALNRFNAEGLQLTFQLLTRKSGANIIISKAPVTASYLASAGFPTATGAPYNSVKVNSSFLGNNPNQNYLATILAHEIGHCIGFRHTDWFDRSISCNGSPTNEGQETSGIGAVHIPNTPTGATNQAGSWMLSCIGSNQDRPFNNDDKTALNYLY